ncbi:MAG: hypothetical protein HC836_36190 [Richelia sp. RM2_1_2]|nr:hypothetical protein [Richelia sp. RM2_1_2]
METIVNESVKYRAGIVKAIIKAFKTKQERGWDKIFFYFDIHETVLYPDYNNVEPEKFYEHAKDVLRYLSTREDIVMALYTCSYPVEIERYQKFFESKEIKFTYINKNPEVANTKYGYYEDKPYYNVLFEDKAGFDAENDWLEIKQYFKL